MQQHEFSWVRQPEEMSIGAAVQGGVSDMGQPSTYQTAREHFWADRRQRRPSPTGRQTFVQSQRLPSDSVEGLWARHARELHDGVTQNIWYLQEELSSLADRMPSGLPELRGDVERLEKVAQDTYKELRATLNSLNSRSTSDVGLAPELFELTLKFSEELAIEVEFQCSEDAQEAKVPRKVEREIRRLVQEAIWNSWRHSRCNRVKVLLERSGAELMVTVSDDGCGFNLEDVDENHYGLRNMRQRAQEINGKLNVTSDVGKGTQVTLQVRPDG